MLESHANFSNKGKNHIFFKSVPLFGSLIYLTKSNRYHIKNHDRNSDQTHKTVTRSFRIRKDWLDILTEDAENQGISVNVLMNLILRRYTNFERLCRDSDVICMSKKAFHELISGVSLEHMAKAAENTGSEDIQKIIDKMRLPSNYESFAYLVNKYFGAQYCADWFRSYPKLVENQNLLNLQHNLGREWSVYLEKYFLSYLKMLNINCETKIYDYAVNIKVPRSHKSLREF